MRIVSRMVAACAAAALSLGGVSASAPGAAAATSTCAVAYSMGNSWPGGFQASITITNNGPAISSWTLAFAFPNDQRVTNGWNGTFTQNGQVLVVTSASYNGALATGASTNIGFTGTVSATNSDT